MSYRLVAPAVLVLVCFLLVAPAPVPILHSMNDGVRPAEEHDAGDSVRSPVA